MIADKARAAGVLVELQVWDGMIHVFQMFGAELPEAHQAIAAIAGFLRPTPPTQDRKSVIMNVNAARSPQSVRQPSSIFRSSRSFPRSCGCCGNRSAGLSRRKSCPMASNGSVTARSRARSSGAWARSDSSACATRSNMAAPIWGRWHRWCWPKNSGVRPSADSPPRSLVHTDMSAVHITLRGTRRAEAEISSGDHPRRDHLLDRGHRARCGLRRRRAEDARPPRRR